MTIKEWWNFKKELSGLKKQAKADFERKVYEAREKNKLINSDSNWGMLEYFIQQCNDNPNLRVQIRTRDGTVIEMKTYEVQKKYEYQNINGVLYSDDTITLG